MMALASEFICKFGKMVEMCHWLLKFCGHFYVRVAPLGDHWYPAGEPIVMDSVSLAFLLSSFLQK